jgi:phenylacetate-CoA ligase
MYKSLNFIIDKVTGFPISSELKNVLEMDNWNRQEINHYQKTKFAILSKIARNSSFYKQYAGKDLQDYPIIDREKYTRNLENLKTNIGKLHSIEHSSGSTGWPVTIHVTREMLLAKRVSHQKMLSWHALKRESPEFKLGGLKELFITKLYYYARNKRYINSFNIKEQNIANIIERYNHFKPALLYGYPSAIFYFLQYAEMKNSRLHQPAIIVTQAENMYEEYKEKFRSTFPNTKIVNQYWATEANIAVTCPEGNLHLDEDTVIGEIINKNESGIGDLLITNLYSYAVPIIRYKVGDRVKFSAVECSCGRKTKVIECLEGRDIDYLELPDGRKIPVTAIYLSKFAKNIVAYQLIHYKSQRLLEFRYIPAKTKEPIDKQLITDYIHHEYGLSTRFEIIDEIQYTRGGKFKKLQVVE